MFYQKRNPRGRMLLLKQFDLLGNFALAAADLEEKQYLSIFGRQTCHRVA